MDICKVQQIVNQDGIVFLSYGTSLTQTLISGMTESLEKVVEEDEINMTASNNIFVIFIELSQNMMNYSKTALNDDKELAANGLIIVTKDNDGNYHIHSQNIISLEDKEKIEPILANVISLDKDGLKKKYRELRKSGKGAHSKGAGIGFYEIAKKCDFINFNFNKINEDRFYFHIETTIIVKKEKK